MADLVAMVTAYRGGDDDGLRVLLDNADRDLVLSLSIHLLARVAGEHGADHPSMLTWAVLAVDGTR